MERRKHAAQALDTRGADLLAWYDRHRLALPWRAAPGARPDPYRVWLSEIMLQQTTVKAVVPYFVRFIARWPNVRALAASPLEDVLKLWAGLGYYARARNLRATAKLVLDRHRGRFPTRIDEMQKLPGIGKYSAHALATFAFDQAVPIVEANTSRALSRLFDLSVPIDSSAGQATLWDRAASLAPKKRAAAYNSALLDLGALICLPRHPKCGICPVKKFCRAKSPESLPIRRQRPQTRRLLEKHALIVRQERILLQCADRRWRGTEKNR